MRYRPDRMNSRRSSIRRNGSRLMASSYSYAVFRYVKDVQRDLTIPVGIALWSNDGQFANTRFVRKDGKVARISKVDDLPYIDLVVRKLGDWLATGELPYQQSQSSPYTDEWWRHVRNLLIHRVRISEPLSVDCQDPESELEPLFMSVVRPDTPEDAPERIDSILRSALGDPIADEFHRGHVDGYAGKPVQVMRVFRGTAADVILDAVNLSNKDAPERADEIVGKLQRARLNGDGQKHKSRSVLAIVGYVSSPGGLNGEAYLKNWIEQGGEAKAFDLVRERDQLRDATRHAMTDASRFALQRE